MRIKVTNVAGGVVVARGPGKFLVRNRTNTAVTFLGLANNPPAGLGNPVPVPTEESWEEPIGGTTGFLREIALGPEESLMALVKAAGAEQIFDVLQTSPRP